MKLSNNDVQVLLCFIRTDSVSEASHGPIKAIRSCDVGCRDAYLQNSDAGTTPFPHPSPIQVRLVNQLSDLIFILI